MPDGLTMKWMNKFDGEDEEDDVDDEEFDDEEGFLATNGKLYFYDK